MTSVPRVAARLEPEAANGMTSAALRPARCFGHAPDVEILIFKTVAQQGSVRKLVSV